MAFVGIHTNRRPVAEQLLFLWFYHGVLLCMVKAIFLKSEFYHSTADSFASACPIGYASFVFINSYS